MQRVAFSPIAIVGVIVCVTRWWNMQKRVKLNPCFYHYFVGKKAVQ